MKTLGPIGIEAFERRSISAETAARFAISIDEMRARFSYDAVSGCISWKNGPRAGREAGTIDHLGYRRIYIEGRQISAGPVCWALEHGWWPEGEIDHINRDRSDNRLANLRIVTRSANLSNRCYAKSGVKGVYWDRRAGKWRAQIGSGRRSRHLGMFASVAAAAAAAAAVEVVR